MIDYDQGAHKTPTLYDLLNEAAIGNTPGRTDTTRTIETSDESASPIEPIISSLCQPR